MTKTDALFSTLIEGLAQLNKRVKENESSSEEIKLELNAFEDEYSKEIKIINDRLDGNAVLVDKLIKEAISKLEKPKDGKDFNPKDLEPLLKVKINKLISDRNIETKKIKSEIIALIENIRVPKDGRDGKDGKNATDNQVSNAISKWIEDNISLLKGTDGRNGRDGLNGKNAIDAISIEDIELDKEYLVITLSDGTTKRIKLPRQKVILGGGGTNLKPLETRVTALEESEGGVSDVEFKKRTEIQSMFDSAKITAYSKMTYDGSNIIKIDIYEDATLATHLFKKDILIVDSKITQTLITRTATGETLKKELFYDGSFIDSSLVTYSA